MATSDPFAFLQGGPGSPAHKADSAAPSESADPFGSIFSKATTPAEDAGQGSPESAGDAFSFLTSGGVHNATSSPSLTAPAHKDGWSFKNKVGDIWNSDENPLEKTWDTINTPLIDKSDIGEQDRHGIVGGLEDFASGMSSPLTVGLTIATMGSGPLLESLGLNVAKMAAPEVINAAKMVGKLASAGFTVGMIKSVADQVPEFTKYLQDGDTDRALESFVNLGLTGTMAGLGAAHTASEFGWTGKDGAAPATTADMLRGRYTETRMRYDKIASDVGKDLKKSVPDQVEREAMHFYGEAEGNVDKLKAWAQQVQDSDKVKPDLKKQLGAVLDKAQNLSDKAVAKLQEIHGQYENMFHDASALDANDQATEASILGPDSYKRNYLARARWDNESDEAGRVDAAKQSIGDGSSDHTQRRIFETSIDGVLQGFKPPKVKGRYVLDAGSVASDYIHQMGHEIAKKQFVVNAKNMLGTDDRPLAVASGSRVMYPEKDSEGNETGNLMTKLYADRTDGHILTKKEVDALTRQNKLGAMVDDGRIIEKVKKAKPAVATQEAAQSAAPEAAPAAAEATAAPEVKAALPNEQPAPEEENRAVLADSPEETQLGNPKPSTPAANEYQQIKATLLERGVDPNDTEAWGTAVAEEEAKLHKEGPIGPSASKAQESTPAKPSARPAGETVAKSPLGELKQTPEGDHVLWLNNEARDMIASAYDKVLGSDPGTSAFDGLHIPKGSIDEVHDELVKQAKSLTGADREEAISKAQEIQKLLRKADDLTDKRGSVLVGNDLGSDEYTQSVLGEEQNHGDQSMLSDDGDLSTHLHPADFKALGREIPMSAHAVFDAQDYPTGRTRVVEYAAKLIGDRLEELNVNDNQAADFLDKYFSAVDAKHGEGSAAREFNHAKGIAKTLLEERAKSGTGLEERVSDGQASGQGVPAVEREGEGGSPGVPQRAAPAAGAGKPAEGEVEHPNEAGRYEYKTSDYDNSVKHRYATTTAYGGADNVRMSVPYAFHPEIAKLAKNILNPEQSFLQKNPVTKAILGLSSQAKQTLLSASGFHWTQIGLRGIESGINPLSVAREMYADIGGYDFNNPAHLKAIESGGLQPSLSGSATMFTEGSGGHGGLLGKVPGVGQVLNKVNDSLFGSNGFIDRMKLKATLNFEQRLRNVKGFEPTVDKYDPMKSQGDANEAKRFKAAGELANQRFGGLNYLALGRSQQAQDIMRLTLLAPDWLESNLRDAASTLGPAGKLTRQDIGRIALYNFAVAQTANLLTTGKAHLDQPFGVVSKDGKKVFTVRTMPADIFHMLTDPRDFAANRLNPITGRTAMELLTQRDKQGHIRTLGQQLQDLISNISPIPLQGAVNTMIGNYHPGTDASDYVRSAAGLTTRPNNSAAETLAYKRASERSTAGALPSAQAANFHKVMEYEDRIRGGDTGAIKELQQDVQDGKLPPNSYRQAVKGSSVPRLQSTVNRLPLESSIDVWNLATNAERKSLAPVMVKKMADFRKTEGQSMTLPERNKMDTKLAAVTSDLLELQQQKPQQ